MTQIYHYANLIEEFLIRKISAKEFEKTYLEKYKSETAPMSDQLYEALDWLFANVDAYTDIEEVLTKFPNDYITEDQLREKAAKTLAELKNIKNNV